jgi:hypothetical protein
MSANMSLMSVDIYGTVSTMVQGTNNPAPAEENAPISLMTTDIQGGPYWRALYKRGTANGGRLLSSKHEWDQERVEI